MHDRKYCMSDLGRHNLLTPHTGYHCDSKIWDNGLLEGVFWGKKIPGGSTGFMCNNLRNSPFRSSKTINVFFFQLAKLKI